MVDFHIWHAIMRTFSLLRLSSVCLQGGALHVFAMSTNYVSAIIQLSFEIMAGCTSVVLLIVTETFEFLDLLFWVHNCFLCSICSLAHGPLFLKVVLEDTAVYYRFVFLYLVFSSSCCFKCGKIFRLLLCICINVFWLFRNDLERILLQ